MVVSIASVLTPRQKMLMGLVNRASSELVVDVVSCPSCGAEPGEYCRGKYVTWTASVHADRRTAADGWRRRNPSAWRRMKDQTFRRLVKRWDCSKSRRGIRQR